ncbi:MAG: valine--tRNA ligase [Halanaerobium sp.]|nr:valine--tRNA ligase [Halanaerobium sp.]
MKKLLAKTYDPSRVEEKWYDWWEDKGYFQADSISDRKSFTIMMPPPNITGELHMGHALDNTLQDIIIRWKRMQGYNALWLPGTDHASIATEVKVARQVIAEGTSKEELGREKFLERVWEWKEEYGGRIIKQLRKFGSSCDWSRERFTMDERCSRAVREAFVQLYEEGLIYRGDYIVNWCPDCGTTLSNEEVEHEDKPGQLYHLRYPIKGEEGYVIVATTRPETMLGDTAVAVNPADERYQELIGKTVILPVVGRELPVIADEYVDPEFGTGAVKVTPAHDPNDFEMGQRHSLELVQVIDDQGKMTAAAGEAYQGLERYQCREKLLQDLKQEGYLLETEEHEHAVGVCYRCDTVIEPLVKKQWFVRMKPLAEPAIKAVKEGETSFIPPRFEKIYLHWLENIRDWCISRQLWWGHRIPVWYCQECGEEIVSREDVTTCPGCGSEHLEQDPDVLDTWFSSGLWPFSTLGWPEETDDLKTFFPTDVLVTGWDIIFFWVARMIFMSKKFMGESPFADVLIHGLILDAQGRKMSKSLGNGVDPLEVVDEYGADTLRFTLITGNTPGNDMRYRPEKVEASRNFANKIWNASRFVLMNLEDYDQGEVDLSELELTLGDRWITSRLNSVIEKVTTAFDRYNFGEAAQALYDFVWSEFCDWYIEMIKPRLYQGQEKERRTAQYMVSATLERILRLLHPVMPFITEEIWQHLPGTGDSIMISSWPEVREEEVAAEAEEEMGLLMDLIRSIRNIRNEMKVNPGRKIQAIFQTEDERTAGLLNGKQGYIKTLAGVEEIEVATRLENRPAKASTAVVKGIEVILPLAGMVDIDKEIERLEKKLAEVAAEIKRAKGKLANEGFVTKAPADLVAAEKRKLEEYQEEKEKLAERLNELIE